MGVLGGVTAALILLAGPDPVVIIGRQTAAGRWELARHLLDRLVPAGSSQSAQMLALRARILARVGTHAEAIKAVEQAIPASPKSAEMLDLKAKLTPTPAPDAALAVPAPRPSIRPRASPKAVAGSIVDRCRELRTLRRLDEAADCFEKILDANPQDFSTFSLLVDILYSRADELDRAGDRSGALARFDRAKRLEEVHQARFANEFSGSLAPGGLATRLGR